jgi:hypothetical protein
VDSAAALLTSVQTRLKATAPLAAIIATRVYGKVPADYAYPYRLYQLHQLTVLNRRRGRHGAYASCPRLAPIHARVPVGPLDPEQSFASHAAMTSVQAFRTKVARSIGLNPILLPAELEFTGVIPERSTGCSHFRIRGGGELFGGSAAGESAKVSQTFQPCGRF